MSKISWTDETLNIITGCTKKGKGCRYCYAEIMHKRLISMENQPKYSQPFSVVQFHEIVLQDVYKWKKPRMVFLNSMSDTFHEAITDEQLCKIFDMIADNPQHTFQVLTKRGKRAMSFFRDNVEYSNLRNVWIGQSVSTQREYREYMNSHSFFHGVHFLSIEPLIERIDLKITHTPDIECLLNWVIVGCESGHNRRPCKIEWIEHIVEQCKKYRIPVFVKQIADANGKVIRNIEQFPKHLQVQEFPIYKLFKP